ncbi:adenosylcobinamide-GDP ribazoletransferase [Stutzerimonas stutzeri]|uniref:Adenosylcobinamide-GDP ribazoletransferase n=1 Tax=Stutzerimonas stutzeri KOS6 TaxID=1218352 RepID=A0A061JM54_STUST|nr:adenosylcobinamide-GDP ribazoletransferase [Stutzerimonas stutzeri]EWC39395.1 cobalamin synthase [Stutzerimonas stutzeri KOS6]
MSPFLIALQFLTSLPIRLPAMPTPEQQGRSLLHYPLVGMLLGTLLWLAALLLDGVPQLLQAALLLTLWVALTGALHLDGLADSADAWLGGFGDRERTLAIMKDPRSGPVAVVVLALLLLLKFSALLALLQAQQSVALLLAPVLGRAVLLALFLGTTYVRPNGLGHALATNLPRRRARGVLAVVALGCLLCGMTGLTALLLAIATFLLARRAMLRRLGGTTGDTAGALLELVECMVLVGLALRVGG